MRLRTPASLRAAAAALILSVGAFAGCTAEDAEPLTCVAGEMRACACTDGRDGVQSCQASGTLAACVCGSTTADMVADTGMNQTDTGTNPTGTQMPDASLQDTGTEMPDASVRDTGTTTAADTSPADTMSGPPCSAEEWAPVRACYDENGCVEMPSPVSCALEVCGEPFGMVSSDCSSCAISAGLSSETAEEIEAACVEGGGQ